LTVGDRVGGGRLTPGRWADSAAQLCFSTSVRTDRSCCYTEIKMAIAFELSVNFGSDEAAATQFCQAIKHDYQTLDIDGYQINSIVVF
jgi:hypothetical protein